MEEAGNMDGHPGRAPRAVQLRTRAETHTRTHAHKPGLRVAEIRMRRGGEDTEASGSGSQVPLPSSLEFMLSSK